MATNKTVKHMERLAVIDEFTKGLAETIIALPVKERRKAEFENLMVVSARLLGVEENKKWIN